MGEASTTKQARHNEFSSERLGPVYYCIFGRLHLVEMATCPETDETSQYAHFSIAGDCVYEGFCDDFGPMNLGSIFRFCSVLEDQHRLWRNKAIALCSEPDGKSLTNTVFLLGVYMMVRLGQPPSSIVGKFEPLREQLLSYRDVSPGEQNFHLQLEDCWQGIWRARKLGWVDFTPTGFSYDEYVHYDDPLNADLHEVTSPLNFRTSQPPRSFHRLAARCWKLRGS
jgi:cell division cycle 14